MNFFSNFIKRRKFKLYYQLIAELKYFLAVNANNVTLDKRIFSLYYFLSCHGNFDDIIVSLNRFIKAKSSYTKNEMAIIRLIKFKLEFPILWMNKFIKG